MKKSHCLCAALVLVGITCPGLKPAIAQSEDTAINWVRGVIKADRQAVVSEALQLTPAEAGKFWPLYHQYRAQMDKVGDGIVKLVKEYGGYYPNIPEARAKTMLKEMLDLEDQQVDTREKFFKKFGKVLPPDKNLRFAQVENRLDLAVKVKLAANIPLTPIEGRWTAEAGRAARIVEGAPGGTVVQTYELTATVAAIDKAAHKVTLLSAEGIKKTVKAGPEVINFDQIRIGDQLKITATEELVVQMAGPGEAADDAAAVVALAPKGAKPGAVAAETTRVTATVTAIDPEKRTATLRFEDGSTRTFPVRSDVDLSKRKVGDQVVFRLTETVAITVSKP
jgi:Cu/Ag efflux protein CusF